MRQELSEDFAAPDTTIGTMSEFLNLLEIRGQSWCSVEIGSTCGFSVAPTPSVIFYACLQGSVRIAGVTGGMIELRPGDVRMILSGEAHAVRVSPASPTKPLDYLRKEIDSDAPPRIRIGNGQISARVLCGRLRVDWPTGLRRNSLPASIKLDTEKLSPLNTVVRVDTLQMCATGSGASALLTRTAALMLALALRSHPQCPLLFRLSTSSDPIAYALELIGSDPSSDWTVGSLAQRVGMGRSNFAARFTAEVGRTPMDVITERRMLVAADLLRQGELKISEISARTGYRSEAAFSRRFTRFFGLPPGQMRHKGERRGRNAARDLSWNLKALSLCCG